MKTNSAKDKTADKLLKFLQSLDLEKEDEEDDEEEGMFDEMEDLFEEKPKKPKIRIVTIKQMKKAK